MKNKIVILPCNGKSAAGRITWIVTQELVLEGKAQWHIASMENEETIAHNEDSNLYILLGGCDQQCQYNTYPKRRFTNTHWLDLPYYGIKPVNMDEITRDDIELAKNAVLAECTPVNTGPSPPVLAACCCK